MTVVIRAIGEADAPAALVVRNVIFHRSPMTLSAYVGRLRQPDRHSVLAELDGRIVAVAHAAPDIWEPETECAFAGVGVLPEVRRRGIGTALFEQVSKHVAATGKRGLTVAVQEDDPESLAYALKRGFAETGRMQQVVLPLDDVEAPEAPSIPGVRIAPLAEDMVEALYGAAREAEADIPTPAGGRTPVPPFAEWRRRMLASAFPHYEHSVVALAGDRIVGYAVLVDAGDRVGDHSMTAVHPEWRGRGIARALKLAQIASAKRGGLRELSAANSFRNAPMVRVNERLGYVRQPAVIQLRGPLLEARD